MSFGIQLLKQGLQISIGNGNNTSLESDPWIPTRPAWAPILKPTTDV